MFQAALDSHLVWLTVLGLLNSAIAAYYYLKIIVAVYMHEPSAATIDLRAGPRHPAHRDLGQRRGRSVPGHLPLHAALRYFLFRFGLSLASEIARQLANLLDDQQPRMTFRQLFVFQAPSARMWNIHRLQTRRQRRIDVRFRRIADHPRPLGGRNARSAAS